MKLGLLGAIVAAGLLVGCGDYKGNVYTLCISPSFSTEQIVASKEAAHNLSEAVAKWSPYASSLVFDIRIGENHCGDHGLLDITATHNAICLTASTREANARLDGVPANNLGVTARQGNIDSATIRISKDQFANALSGIYTVHSITATNRSLFIGTVALEIGHALGLEHDLHEGTLMFASREADNNLPTKEDVEILERIRGN